MQDPFEGEEKAKSDNSLGDDPWMGGTRTTAPRTEPPRHFLLAEIDPVQVRYLRKRLEVAGREVHFHQVHDGVKVLDYLSQTPPWGENPKPEIVFLNVDLAGINGYQVVEKIRKNPKLNTTPLVLMGPDGLVIDRVGRPNRIIKYPQNMKVHPFFAVVQNFLNIPDIELFPPESDIDNRSD